MEDNSPKTCNDADTCPTLRPSLRGKYLPAPRDAPVGSPTGRPWQYLAAPIEARGNPAIHDTTIYTVIYTVFTRRAADGSLWQACIARMAHRAAAKYLDARVLHGDGTNAVATQGAMELDRRDASLRQERRISRSQAITALSQHLPLLLPPMRQT